MKKSAPIYLVVDIGTSDIKCACINAENQILSQFNRKFPMEQTGPSYEIDFELFFKRTCELISACLSDKEIRNSKVEALLVTSQAQTFTSVDVDFQPLHKGIVWLDERASDQAKSLDDKLNDFSETAGFERPLPSLYVSKLLWIKQNNPARFKRARDFPLINEYLIQRLTGHFYSDNTSFGMSGMYNYRQNAINKKIMQILDLNEDFFPKIDRAAMRGELISRQVQQEWGLDYCFPVYLCGNDQGASACGAGLRQVGDMSINFGTAMVFYAITKSLNKIMNMYQIAGKHPVGKNYFLLNYESDFGLQIRRLKDRYFQNEDYNRLFKTYLDHPGIDGHLLRPNDVDLSFDSQDELERYCAGVIKYHLNRIQSHQTQINDSVQLKNIMISGGMVLSEVWLEVLQSTLDQPFTINNRDDAGVMGAVHIYLQNKIGNRLND